MGCLCGPPGRPCCACFGPGPCCPGCCGTPSPPGYGPHGGTGMYGAPHGGYGYGRPYY